MQRTLAHRSLAACRAGRVLCSAAALRIAAPRTQPRPQQQQLRFSHYNTAPAPGAAAARPPITVLDIKKMHKNKVPISVITAHDYISAVIAERAGVDVILVGDSLSMVALGYENTNEIELDEMIYHAKAVSRGSKSCLRVADLPFGSYEVSPEQAAASAIRMIKRGDVHAIKMEGGVEQVGTVRKLTAMGVAVMGHIGLTPQRQASLGGFRVQGKSPAAAESILRDALALQDAGCFAVVLEAVPSPIADLITQKLKIPTIGIGAGPHTSGQVLVQLDMLGGFDGFTPKFLKKYSNYLKINTEAIEEYNKEVKERQFPEPEHCYNVKQETVDSFKKLLEEKYSHL